MDTFKGKGEIDYRFLLCKNKFANAARTRKFRNSGVSPIHGDVRCTDLICILSSVTEDSEDVSCQYHTPVADELYEILTRNICDIFTLCKDPLLSCNANQGGVNILTRVSNLAGCLTHSMSHPLHGLVPVLV